MSGRDGGQPRASGLVDRAVENLAFDLLAAKLRDSVDRQREWGGVIHRHASSGAIGSTGPFLGYSSTGVDIEQDKPNMGCPEGTLPVAWYHTHPVAEVYTLGKLCKADWDKFIGGDKTISDSHNIPGYVGTFDGRFWRYLPPPPQNLNGHTVYGQGPGSFEPLPRRFWR